MDKRVITLLKAIGSQYINPKHVVYYRTQGSVVFMYMANGGSIAFEDQNLINQLLSVRN